jgi:hypothetical protein
VNPTSVRGRNHHKMFPETSEESRDIKSWLLLAPKWVDHLHLSPSDEARFASGSCAPAQATGSSNLQSPPTQSILVKIDHRGAPGWLLIDGWRGPTRHTWQKASFQIRVQPSPWIRVDLGSIATWKLVGDPKGNNLDVIIGPMVSEGKWRKIDKWGRSSVN